MSRVIVTLKVMPEGPEVDLDSLKEAITKQITDYAGTVMSMEKEPIGFGLIAWIVRFNMDESTGSTDELEEKIAAIEGVASTQVTMVTRAFG